MFSCWLIFSYWFIFSYWLLHEAALSSQFMQLCFIRFFIYGYSKWAKYFQKLGLVRFLGSPRMLDAIYFGSKAWSITTKSQYYKSAVHIGFSNDFWVSKALQTNLNCGDIFSAIFLGRHSLMAGLRIPIQFLEERTLPPFFESKCPFFIYIIFHFFHSHHL